MTSRFGSDRRAALIRIVRFELNLIFWFKSTEYNRCVQCTFNDITKFFKYKRVYIYLKRFKLKYKKINFPDIFQEHPLLK